MGCPMSFMPYVILTTVAVFTLTIDPANRALGIEYRMAFLAVATGYGVVNDAAEPQSPFSPLTHPATFLLITALPSNRQHTSRP